MGNVVSFGWKDTFWLGLVLLLVAEIMMPGSISIARDLLRIIAGIAYSCLDRSQQGLTAAEIPIPADLFGKVSDAAVTPPTQDPIIHDTSRTDRICGYIDVRRQFVASKLNLFNGQGGTYTAGGRLPGLLGQDDSDSSTKSHGQDLAASISKALDASASSRSDSVDESTSISSTATTTSNISTKANNGSATSLPAIAPKTAGLWAAARNAMPVLTKPTIGRERYYCVLKNATIYLYDDDKQTQPVHVIAVDKYTVKVHTADGEFQGRDGEMFNKKHAIVLQHHTSEESDDGLPGAPMSRKNSPTFRKKGSADEGPWYLIIKNHSEMEDWYLALLRQSHSKVTHEKTFSPMDMHNLVDTITNEVDPIASRWINSLLGTLFLRVCETAFAEKFIIGKIMRKLDKRPKDSLPKDVVIREVNLGTIPPSPMLKDIQASGQTAIDFHFLYDARKATSSPDAGFRITFAAVFAYGPLSMRIVAAAKVKYIEGDMTAKIKSAPSNRIWYGFTSEPKMELDIVLIFADGKGLRVENKILIDMIRSKIKTAVSDAIVVPNMDDLPFFSTVPNEASGVPEGYPRGGIFDLASKMMASETDRGEVTIKESRTSQQPGIAVNTSNIQAASALGKHAKGRISPTKRDNSPSKYKGQGISSASITPPKKKSPIRASIPLPGMGYNKKKDKKDDLMIHKNITEPVLSTEPMLVTDPNDVDTRGRLEHQRAAPPRVRKVSPDSDNSLGLDSTARPSDSGTVPVLVPARPQTIHGDVSGTAGAVGSSLTRSSMSPSRQTGGIQPPSRRPLSTASIESKDAEPAVSISRTSSQSDSVLAPTDQVHAGHNAIRSPAPDPAAVDAASAISAASVLDLFKARDRQGLEAKGNVAKVKLTKWGIDSLARGKAEYYQRFKGEAVRPANADAQTASIPVPNQSQAPPATSHTTGTSPTAHLARSPGKSLQERLRETARAAEAANAATMGYHPDGRVRSGSNTSNLSSSSAARPALLSSPSKGEPSISGTDFVSATHHSTDSTSVGRRSSTSTSTSTSVSTTPPVLAQPAAGRGMVVPRMTKRSGEVTGLGGGKSSEQNDPADKSTSNGFTDLPAESRDTTTINVGPPLPPRHAPAAKPKTDSAPIIAGSSRPFPTMTGAPSPPARKDRSVSPIATKPNSLMGLANLGNEDVSMERSRSLPGQPRQPPAPPPVRSKTRPTSMGMGMGMGVRSLSFSLSRGSKSTKGKKDGKESVSDMTAFERSLSFEDMLNDARGPDGLEDPKDGEDAVLMTKKEKDKKKTSPSRAQHALRKFSDKPSPTKTGELRLGSHVQAPE